MRKVASFLPLRLRRQVLRVHLARYADEGGARLSRSIVVQETAQSGELVCGLKRTGTTIYLGLGAADVVRTRSSFRLLYARMPVMLHVFARTAAHVSSVEADFSDGNQVRPGALCFCSERDDVLLVPDPLFFNSRGYAALRRHASTAPPWSRREDMLIWRGASTGVGELATEEMDPRDDRLRQRVRLCLQLASVPGTDAKFSKIVQSPDLEWAKPRLAARGILGGKISPQAWRRLKFAIDIDGNTNAWSNLYTRLLLGCCVLKVGSPLNFKQWYYHDLRPWIHFVPVRADLSDLLENIDWCRTHDPECEAIARNGQAFALTRTVETEISDAVRRLSDAFASRTV